MKKNLLLALTCVAWTTIHQASDNGQRIRADLIRIGNVVNASKNLLDDKTVIALVRDNINDTNSWLNKALTTNKSDTLNGIYESIKYYTQHIVEQLDAFNGKLSAIKTDIATLNEFRKKAAYFSEDRDRLKKLLKEDNNLTKLKQHKKPLLRSQKRENAKQEIADVLIDYAETFVKISQKAINDFAALDAALFNEIQEENKRILQQEKNKKLSNPAKPRTSVHDELPTEPIPAEEVDWSDW